MNQIRKTKDGTTYRPAGMEFAFSVLPPLLTKLLPILLDGLTKLGFGGFRLALVLSTTGALVPASVLGRGIFSLGRAILGDLGIQD